MAVAPDVEFEDGVAPKKGKGLLFAIVGVVLVLGAGGAYLGLSGGGGDEAKAAKEVRKPAEIGPIVAMDTFVVNLNAHRANRYLKVTLAVELAGEGMDEEMTKRKPIIRDAVISYLSGLSVDEVRGSETKDAIREQLLSRINKAFGAADAVKRVMFTEFVVQ